MNLIEIAALARKLALEAGQLCLSMQNNLPQAHYKGPKDVVTEADLACDTFLRKALRQEFPHHSIRTEEGVTEGPAKAERQWIIDPIDGTVNFSRGIPLWGISLALVENGTPLVAVCHLPRLQELFWAVRGEGAFLQNAPIFVSNTVDLSKCVISNGDFNVGQEFGAERLNTINLQNFRTQAENCQRVKCVGSAVVEGCFVACGRLDAYAMTVSFPWDIAGVALLVKEAGGMVTSLDGKSLQLRDGEAVLFSNGHLHPSLIHILHSN